MKEIKFRGIKTSDGGYVYGDLSHDGSHVYINDKRVFENSVAQLLCVDDNGDEVYDCDELVSKDGEEYRAELAVVWYSATNGEHKWFNYLYNIGTLDGFTLKRKANHEENN